MSRLAKRRVSIWRQGVGAVVAIGKMGVIDGDDAGVVAQLVTGEGAAEHGKVVAGRRH